MVGISNRGARIQSVSWKGESELGPYVGLELETTK